MASTADDHDVGSPANDAEADSGDFSKEEIEEIFKYTPMSTALLDAFATAADATGAPDEAAFSELSFLELRAQAGTIPASRRSSNSSVSSSASAHASTSAPKVQQRSDYEVEMSRKASQSGMHPKVDCIYSNCGCQEKVLKGTWLEKDHYEQCNYRPLRCILPDHECNEEIPFYDYLLHIQTHHLHPNYTTNLTAQIIIRQEDFENDVTWSPKWLSAWGLHFFLHLVRKTPGIWSSWVDLYDGGGGLEPSSFLTRITYYKGLKHVGGIYPVQSIRVAHHEMEKERTCLLTSDDTMREICRIDDNILTGLSVHVEIVRHAGRPENHASNSEETGDETLSPSESESSFSHTSESKIGITFSQLSFAATKKSATILTSSSSHGSYAGAVADADTAEPETSPTRLSDGALAKSTPLSTSTSVPDLEIPPAPPTLGEAGSSTNLRSISSKFGSLTSGNESKSELIAVKHSTPSTKATEEYPGPVPVISSEPEPKPSASASEGHITTSTSPAESATHLLHAELSEQTNLVGLLSADSQNFWILQTTETEAEMEHPGATINAPTPKDVQPLELEPVTDTEPETETSSRDVVIAVALVDTDSPSPSPPPLPLSMSISQELDQEFLELTPKSSTPMADAVDASSLQLPDTATAADPAPAPTTHTNAYYLDDLDLDFDADLLELEPEMEADRDNDGDHARRNSDSTSSLELELDDDFDILDTDGTEAEANSDNVSASASAGELAVKKAKALSKTLYEFDLL